MSEPSDEEKEDEEKAAASPDEETTLPIRYGDQSSGEVLGNIYISDEVVSAIASRATAEVDGIIGLVGRFSFGEMLGRKDVDKGVSVEIDYPRAKIDLVVNVEYGVNIYDVCHRLQRNVKDKVEETTGLVVEFVNVNVRGIAEPPREPKERGRQQTA